MGSKSTLLLLWLLIIGNFLNAQSPNFLVIIADDAGYRDFGCYGNPAIQTPNIDQLAKTGFKANQAFLTTPQCSPSRINILSGQYAHTTRTEDLHTPMPKDVKILPTYLQEKNYYTGWMLKKHVGPEGDKQFQWYSNKVNDFSTFLDQANNKPFFFWTAFYEPHRIYEEETPALPHDPAKTFVPPYLADTPETRQDLAHYYDEIARMDRYIGNMIQELKKRGLYDNTVVIFLSDNGAPFPREKGTLYDAGIKTPFIIHWANKIKKTVVYNGLISVIDLAPTILDLAGIKTPETMGGQSFASIFTNPDAPGRKYVFSERNWHDCDEHMRSVRTDRYKLIKNAYIELPHGTAADISGSPTWRALKALKDQGKLTPAQALLFQVPRPMIELYDLENDPYELVNLAGRPDYQPLVLELSKALHQWMRDTGDFSPFERRKEDNTDRITGAFFSPDIQFNTKGN